MPLKYTAVLLFFVVRIHANKCHAYSLAPKAQYSTELSKSRNQNDDDALVVPSNSRREILLSAFTTIIPILSTTTTALFSKPSISNAALTPGGSLVDRDVGVSVGNLEASPSRKTDNSNVLFSQDNYFKFGSAAQWIEPDSTEYPKTMPFVLSQQRYDNLKKYGSRVQSGIDTIIDTINSAIKSNTYATIADASDPIYQIRPLGLLANGFLASENTGATNELFLARWYINEIYLRIGDVKGAATEGDAFEAYGAAKKAINSYLSMMNRQISSKVGEKFKYV